MEKSNYSKSRLLIVGLAFAGVIAAGCADDAELTSLPPAPSTEPPALGPFQYKDKVGVPVQQSSDSKLISNLAQRVQPTRSDPFALLPVELRFDQSQRGELLLQQSGGFSTMFEPEEEVDESQIDAPEPQPYRRLAGILVADTVSAIIIMEDGNAYLIRPGTRIPNSPWRVVSIDEEKAVLRRAGSQKPTQIIVRLESPPAGVGGGGFNPGGGGAPAGNPRGGGRLNPAGGGAPGGIGADR